MALPERRAEDAPRGRALDRDAAEAIARTLRAVADPTRIQLLALVLGAPNAEATVGELAEALGLRQPTVTHHLGILAEDGVIVKAQRGRQVWVSIAPERLASVEDLLR